jgi:broad specificity phosphatase PhoE
MRHFKVQHQWKDRYSSREFDFDQEAYDARPICETRDIEQDIEKVYISELPRARSTCECLVGEKRVVMTPLINEIKLRAFMETDWALPISVWDRMSLIQWRLGGRRQLETRRETIERANEFVRLVEAEEEDCIVVSHCLFLRELSGVMRKRGFRGQYLKELLKNGEMIEYRKG